MTTITLARRGGALLAAAVLAVTAACGGGGDSSDAATQASTVTITDPWVKAGDSGMTAAFGQLRNAGDTDATVVAVSTDISPMELHEMATDDSGKMVMREKEGGFVIPAGKTHQLDPGGDHLMLMDITKPVKPGDKLTFTLTFADKSTMSFTAPARSYSGANEDYDGSDKDMDHDGMDMEHGDDG